MNFYEISRKAISPPINAEYPCAILTTDGWNDFGFYTLWGLDVYQNKDNRVVEGTIKILQWDATNPTEAVNSTKIPKRFTQLGEQYCSLGQSIEIYEQLRLAGPDIYRPFLSAIRDAATSIEIASRFKEMVGFRKSLVRFSEAEKAFSEARSLFEDVGIHSSFQFRFTCSVPGASAPHEVDFDFSNHPTGLNRVAVIIGKNGTGKTQFLARFAHAMSGLTDSSSSHGFFPKRPSFSRVIAVSYSVFDNFTRPSGESGHNRTFSYRYCGIRSSNSNEARGGAQFLSTQELQGRLIKAVDLIVTSDRQKIWSEVLQILLEDAADTASPTVTDLSFYEKLSSGQKILVAVMTEIVAHISRQSVILFDEPELHLHPEVLAALARSIDRLLLDFDSFAIIATHSSLLLQETLSRQVRIFRRNGDIPRIDPLTVESFGENLTTITREVFAVDGEKHNFRSILEKLASHRDAEQVERLFPLGLPLQAQAFLQAHKRERTV